ncbi:MAG TPA: CPBP family intramembrane glutamic endopeptidase [Symbiobacteriaceae bacterium]|nr:CPBP family intramembrane glutamic endopeptidase [Symbiobacteriaceae bacterium]
METSRRRSERNVWAFFLWTFAYSWLLWLPFVLPGLGVIKPSPVLNALSIPAVLLGGFAPLFAAVTMVARQGGWSAVRQYFRQALNLRVKAQYYLLALLLPLVVTAAAHYIANWTGMDRLPATFLPANWPVWVISVAAIGYFVAMLLAGGGQEEFGWRGYAQEPLQERFGMVRGSLLLGLVWSLWHLPLWLIPTEHHSDYPFLAFVLSTTSLALIMGCLYNLSGKKLVITWVVHAMNNTVVPFFPVLHMAKVAQPGYWLWAGLYALTALGLTAWVWRRVKDGRLGEAAEQPPLVRRHVV